jgi:hypothetical protein
LFFDLSAMPKLIIAIALAATLGDACDVFKHGRVSVGVEGMSDTCCSSISTLQEKIAKTGARWGPGAEPEKQEQKTEMAIMTAFVSNCCGSKDQGVLSTLVPEEPPDAAEQIAQMCTMGGPPSILFAAKILRISPIISPVKHASAKQADFLSLSWSGSFDDQGIRCCETAGILVDWVDMEMGARAKKAKCESKCLEHKDCGAVITPYPSNSGAYCLAMASSAANSCANTDTARCTGDSFPAHLYKFTSSQVAVELDASVAQHPFLLVMLLVSVSAAGIATKVAMSRREGSSIDQRGLLG